MAAKNIAQEAAEKRETRGKEVKVEGQSKVGVKGKKVTISDGAVTLQKKSAAKEEKPNEAEKKTVTVDKKQPAAPPPLGMFDEIPIETVMTAGESVINMINTKNAKTGNAKTEQNAAARDVGENNTANQTDDTDTTERTESNCFCKKEHIDLRPDVAWVSQFNDAFGDEEAQKQACFRACKRILQSAGLSGNSAPNDGTVIQTALESNGNISINSQKAKEGLAYIDGQLERKYPVLVGIDCKSGSPNTDKVTDHFVVIVGRGCGDDKAFYYFYEVGTKYKDSGTSDGNKLFVNNDNSLRGKPVYNVGKNYTVSQIRRNVLL
jgi:hypothetical protein